MSFPRIKECVYCPSTENLTSEHAPPKLVFPEPRPSDLITVPACRSCNEAGSKDAEYFRVCLCLNPLVKDTPSVVALKPTVQQSLQREKAKGFKTALLKSLEPDQGKIIFTYDMGRIHLVIRRTVQCLYLHDTGTKLPTETHETRVASIEMLSKMEPGSTTRLHETFINPLMKEPIHLYAGNQFAYWVIHTGKPFVSVWALLFYGTLPFVGFTGPKVKVTDDNSLPVTP